MFARPLRSFALTLAAAALPTASAIAADVHGIAIVPGPVRVAARSAVSLPQPEEVPMEVPVPMAPEEAPEIAPGPVAAPNVADYNKVYRAIPFSRAEYDANPSYRHEATMEFLFGELRPMTIIKEQYRSRGETEVFDYMTPYGYRRGRARYNYNFFWPRPSVYRNY